MNCIRSSQILRSHCQKACPQRVVTLYILHIELCHLHNSCKVLQSMSTQMHNALYQIFLTLCTKVDLSLTSYWRLRYVRYKCPLNVVFFSGLFMANPCWIFCNDFLLYMNASSVILHVLTYLLRESDVSVGVSRQRHL